MARKLIARLTDGSEHPVRHAGTPEEALMRLTGVEKRSPWLDIEHGRVRYDCVMAFHVVEVDSEDAAINQLLREFHAAGGATSLDQVRRELDVRGIGTPRASAQRSD